MKVVKPNISDSHWYSASGESRHDADLRVARKQNLFPSVTGILGIKAKPALDAWKINEAILAALTLPRLDNEPLEQFAQRVAIDMKETSSKAAQIGTLIHDFCERYVSDKSVACPDGYEEVCEKVKVWIDSNLGAGKSEESMVSELGYAGRKDWTGLFVNRGFGILDFKTQGVKPGKKPVFYPEHCYQLAAYANGKPMQLCNLIISTNPDNPVIEEKWWTKEEIEEGWEIFKHLLAVWQLERGYKPTVS